MKRLKVLLRGILKNARIAANFDPRTKDGQITKIIDKYGRTLSPEEYQLLIDYNWVWQLEITVHRTDDNGWVRSSVYEIINRDSPCSLDKLRDHVDACVNDHEEDHEGFVTTRVDWIAKCIGGDNKPRKSNGNT